MKRAFKLVGALLALAAGVAVAVPVFFIAAGLGPVFVSVLVAAFVLVVLWVLFGRRQAAAGPASESSFLRQSSKDGLL